MKNQNMSMIKYLLNLGARPSDITIAGDSALHLATKNRMTEAMVHFLTNFSSFKYIQDKQGFIPFDYAKVRGYHFLTKMLKINNWHQISPEYFIEKNKEFLNANDDEFIQNCMLISNPKEDYWIELIEEIIRSFYPYPDTIDINDNKSLDQSFYIKDTVSC